MANPLLTEAIACLEANQLERAQLLAEQAASLDARDADAWHLAGVALARQGQHARAVDALGRAIALNPESAQFHANLGNAHYEQGHYSQAIDSYRRAIGLAPSTGGVGKQLAHACERQLDLGIAHHRAGRHDEAKSCYESVLRGQPQRGDAWHLLGVLAYERQDYAAAIELIAQALQCDPSVFSYHVSMGSIALAQKDYAGALASYETALRLKPDSADALLYRGDALNGLKRLDEALGSYDRALASKPDLAFASGSRLHVKMRICDWRDLANDFDLLGKAIGNGERVSQPFPLLATPLSAALQRRCAETYTRAKHPERPLFPQVTHRYEHDRIRLGYFSADFHNHATSYLMAELFERHDRTRFELNAFSLGPVENDAMSARLKKAFDRFFELGSRSDKDVALLSRSLEIDIAVDLKGFTGGSRTSIFALRPAPIQVNYLGYPGTMGAGYIDYLIADSTLIPEDQQQHYAEKIVYLPDTYQVNDSKRLIAETRFSKAECGLPEEGFIFCCFNKNYKVAPAIFDIWMRLLSKVDGSVLWLWGDNSSASKNLRAQAQSRGVAPDRLVFAKHMPLSEHLARHRLADLFLDTLPYNAHTTASDALWAGLPVLTCPGETFPGRVAASLLNAVGLPELIARTLDDYEARALELATNPGKRHRLRQKLAANRSTAALFDSTLFTKHIEIAYVAMWTRHQAGLAPEHIYVGPEIHTV